MGVQSGFRYEEMEIGIMEETAQKAYHNQPAATAIWALENFICVLNRVKSERAPSESENPYFILIPNQSLILAHTRLALLYEKMNDYTKSTYHFERAMTNSKNAGLKAIETQTDLINLVNRIYPNDEIYDKSTGKQKLLEDI